MFWKRLYIPWTILICFGKDYPSANKNSNGHLRVFTQERNHENDKKFLQKVFERIDEDGAARGAGRLKQWPNPCCWCLWMCMFEVSTSIVIKHHTMMTRVDLVWLSGVGQRLTMKNGTKWLVICSTYIRDLCQGVVSWRWTNWSKVLARTARKCEIWPNEYYVVITHMWFP